MTATVLPLPRRRDTTSWSEINTRRQCPFKHKLHYLDGWRPPTISRPLSIGLFWHEIMQLHYASLAAQGNKPGRKVDLEPILELFKDHGAKDPDHPEYDISSLCLWMYDGYRKMYGPDGHWEIIQVEEDFKLPLPGTDLFLVGRIDIVVRWNRKLLWVVDHKANRNLPHEKDFDLDDQLPLYIWATKQATNLAIAGGIFNVARYERLKRAMDLEERFHRYPTYRSDHALEVVVQEAADTLHAAYGSEARHERHPDPANCKWRCQFVEPCVAGRAAPGLTEQLLVSYGFKQTGSTT